MEWKLSDCFFALMEMRELGNELKSLNLTEDKSINEIFQIIDRVCANFMRLNAIKWEMNKSKTSMNSVVSVEFPIRLLVESAIQENYPTRKTQIDLLLEDISIENVFRYRVSSLKVECVAYILYSLYCLSQRCLNRLLYCNFNLEGLNKILRTIECDLGNLSMLCCKHLSNNSYFIKIYMIANIAQFLVKQTNNLQFDPIVKALVSDSDFEIRILIRKCLELESSRLRNLFKLLTIVSNVSAGNYTKLFILRLLLLAAFATEFNRYQSLTKIKEKFRDMLAQWKVNYAFKRAILKDIEIVLSEAQKDTSFQKKRPIARVLAKIEKYVTSCIS